MGNSLLEGLGIILLLTGGVLISGLVQISYFQYCIGLVLFGVCVGYNYNYAWLVGIGVAALGIIVLLFGLKEGTDETAE
jgi:hypothetical protein